VEALSGFDNWCRLIETKSYQFMQQKISYNEFTVLFSLIEQAKYNKFAIENDELILSTSFN
jgi:hypothetical protein